MYTANVRCSPNAGGARTMHFLLINIITIITISIPITHTIPSIDFTVDDYPDSLVDIHLCGLTSPGLICDPYQLLGKLNHSFTGL